MQALIIVSLVFLVSCKCNKSTSSKMENTNIESVLIAKGNLYGSGEEGITAQNLIITNQEDWDALLSKMNSVNNVSDSFSETKLDFSKYCIIAVIDTVKGSGGHSIALDMTSTSKNTIVKVSKKAPKGNATSVMTQPYYIVKLKKQELPIVFQ